MENKGDLFQNYSQRSSFMLYAELALMQGLPIGEVRKRLEQMEKDIEQMGVAQSEIRLSTLGALEASLN